MILYIFFAPNSVICPKPYVSKRSTHVLVSMIVLQYPDPNYNYLYPDFNYLGLYLLYEYTGGRGS
jgi:hypothetical protein